jgi:hypothetical protein
MLSSVHNQDLHHEGHEGNFQPGLPQRGITIE